MLVNGDDLIGNFCAILKASAILSEFVMILPSKSNLQCNLHLDLLVIVELIKHQVF